MHDGAPILLKGFSLIKLLQAVKQELLWTPLSPALVCWRTYTW